MAGLSFSPYAGLWFVGTDMGTLFRSTDEGRSWQALSHREIRFDSDLSRSSSVGFSSDGKTVFFAEGGRKPKRSRDAGMHWEAIPLPIAKDEYVRYWIGDSADPRFILCGTSKGLLKSADLGSRWQRVAGVEGESLGTVIIPGAGEPLIFHANSSGIFRSKGRGGRFERWFAPSGTAIRAFAGGARDGVMTLAYLDSDGANACRWAETAQDPDPRQRLRTQEECGYVWVDRGSVSRSGPKFTRTEKEGGSFLRMAENDPDTLYVTGGHWVRQYGTKVWVSRDAGTSWALRFQLYNWDTRPYSPWPREKLEYSAVGVDVGWADGFFPSFEVNQRNSAQAGGTGYYFVHVTDDFGDSWKAPFTQFADTGERTAGKRWKSVGLEVTSVHRLKFHPKSPRIGFAAVADIGGLVTEDGGESWRIAKAQYNTNHDYAFDPAREKTVYAASGSLHDFPVGNNQVAEGTQGGIFRSDDLGRSWTRLTPRRPQWNIAFLSVAYDPLHGVLYGGSRGKGVARSRDGGRTWEYLNDGMPRGGVIPQLEVDGRSGSVYALLTGDAPRFSNQEATGIYVLDVASQATRWRLLRGKVHHPPDVKNDVKLWWFPTSFAVDFSDPERRVLWLTDMESQGAWLASGAWKSSDGGKNWVRAKQFTRPTDISVDPGNPRRIFVSGPWEVDGSWGDGGALYSNDGGLSWKKNEGFPILANLLATVPDPNRADQVFYLFFGGGMLYGPAPGGDARPGGNP